MRRNGISIVKSRNHKFNIASSLLNRYFVADRPNKKWVVDISYVWTREGWRPWHTRRAGKLAIFEYINGFYNSVYNPRRKRSVLG